MPRIPDPGESWEEGQGPQPRDYWKDKEGWKAISPNGLLINLKGHHVDEHEDGTISVIPTATRSNSILVSTRTGQSWHGYINQGTWNEAS